MNKKNIKHKTHTLKHNHTNKQTNKTNIKIQTNKTNMKIKNTNIQT